MNDSAGNQHKFDAMIANAMSTTDLILPEDMSFEDMLICAKRLGDIQKGSMWAIGALLVQCEAKLGNGKKYKEIQAATGLEYGTCRNAKSVWKKVDLSLRGDKLPFSFYQVVAPMQDTYQKRYLDIAAEKGFTRKQLVAHIKEDRKVETVSNVKKKTHQILFGDISFGSMEITDIEQSYINEMGGEDSILLLYARRGIEDTAMKILHRCGYEYQTVFCIETENIITTKWGNTNHNVLVLGAKGSFPTPNPTNSLPSFIKLPVQTGIAENCNIYNLIDSMFPSIGKYDLFDRGGGQDWAWNRSQKHDPQTETEMI